jgi:hypothetical protein
VETLFKVAAEIERVTGPLRKGHNRLGGGTGYVEFRLHPSVQARQLTLANFTHSGILK